MTASALRPTLTARSRSLGAALAVPAKRGLSAVLRVPLLAKILGANLVLMLGAVGAHYLLPDASMVQQLGILLLASFAATSGLAWLALRPLARLEATADRVWRGDFAARVPLSPIADRDIARLSATMNRLLDRVEADRARIHYLAGRSVRARDVEREGLARELRDSLAQMVAGVALQIAAARQANSDPSIDSQLDESRLLLQQLGDEIRAVAETLYPGTLGEFGLVNALSALSRMTARRLGIVIEVAADSFDAPLSAPMAAALYRVADEALRNVAQHSGAKSARLTLRAESDSVCLTIEDDGRGLDMLFNDPLQAGLGLFSARAVLALVGGDIQISSAPEKGTRVRACVPVNRTSP